MAFPTSPTDGQQTTVNNIVYSYSAANTTWNRVTTNINSVITPAFDVANSAAIFANGAFSNSNTNTTLATAAFGQANTATTLADAAFSAGNTTNTLTTAAFGQANTGTTLATAAFGAGNTTNTLTTAAFGQANTATTLATAAFGSANNINLVDITQNTNITLVGSYANSAYLNSNTAAIFANGAFDRANTVWGISNNKLDLTSGGTVAGATSFTGVVTFQDTTDVMPALSVSTTTNYDVTSGSAFYHSSVATGANWTANFTNVPTTDNRTFVVTIVVAQGGTAYIPNAVQIGGAAQTINWIGGAAPTGGAGKKDIFAFSLLRTGATWIVLGQSASYG